MIGIIFAFLAGVLFGGFCVYSYYYKKCQDINAILDELDAESKRLLARINELCKIYGIDITNDGDKEVTTND